MARHATSLAAVVGVPGHGFGFGSGLGGDGVTGESADAGGLASAEVGVAHTDATQ